MSLLDAILTGPGGGFDPAVLAAINAQLASHQGLITAQQAALDGLATSDDVQAAVDAAQAAAIAAAAAVNTAQAAELTANAAADATRAEAIVAILARLELIDTSETMGVRVERFAPGRILTTGNFEAALGDAMAYANAIAVLTRSVGYGTVPNVLMPYGEWPITALKYLPGTYPSVSVSGNTPSPGLVGAGSNQTVLVLQNHLADGAGLVTIGAALETAPTPYITTNPLLRGFRLCTTSGEARGNGIRVNNACWLQMDDVIVEGFAANQSVESGWGLYFATETVPTDNNQYPRINNCTFRGNQGGIRMRRAGIFLGTNVQCKQNKWKDVLHDNVGGSFIGGSIESGAQPANTTTRSTRWYGGIAGPFVSTGFDYVTGMPSGSGATLSTASYDVNACGTCTVGGLLSMTPEMVNRCLILGAHSGAADIISGAYLITEYVSPNTVKIAKGTSHTAQVGVPWRVGAHAGGSVLAMSGFVYHEAPAEPLYFFGPDEHTSSRYELSGVLDYNTIARSVVADRIFHLTVKGLHPGTRVYARQVGQLVTDLPASAVDMDGFTRANAQCWASNGGGPVAAGRPTKHRIRSLLRELGAVLHVSSRHVERISLTGSLINSYTDLSNGIVSTLGNGTKPTYNASDAAAGGVPMIENTGVHSVSADFLRFTIPGGVLPTKPYKGHMFAVLRKRSMGLQNSGTSKRQISVSSAAVGLSLCYQDENIYGLGVNMGTPTNIGFAVTSYTNGLDDLGLHAACAGFVSRSGVGDGAGGWDGRATISDERYGSANMSASATNPTSFPGDGTSLDVLLGTQPGANAGDLSYAEFAFIPRDLTIAEVEALLDAAANEFPTIVR